MNHNIIIQGIRFDANSSFMKGSADAPALIKDAFFSDSINAFTELGINVTQNHAIAFVNDIITVNYFDDIFNITSHHIKNGKRVVTLGGDHSITYPIIAAHAKKYDQIEILQIDAHTDLYQDFEGDPHSHACPFARIMENKLAARLIQVGIRCLTPHQKEQVKKYKVEVLEMKDYSLLKIPKIQKPLYISLDIDAIDPAFAPGVSHYEPGGLSTRQVLEIIHSIEAPIIGADIVEYNPKRDPLGITGALAAKLLKEITGKMLMNGSI